MIPKIIHYCWFGRKEKPDFFLFCLESWKKYLPDYQIIEWNEENFEFPESNLYLKGALEAEKWAYVSDYVRIFMLHKMGGLYMDIDVEIKNNLDEFLTLPFFIGLEKKGYVSTALIGSTKGHKFLNKILEYYNRQQKFEIKTNNMIISSLLKDEYNFDLNEETNQKLFDGIHIFSNTFFSLDIPKTYATPWSSFNNNSYRNHLQIKYYLEQINSYENVKTEINNMINNQHLFNEDYILDNIPIKNIIRYLQKKIFYRLYLQIKKGTPIKVGK